MRGRTRIVDTFRFQRGIVYRRRIVSMRIRRIVRVVKVVLPITIDATDDQGVDRVSVMIDGRVAGVDWNASDGWSVTAECSPGLHQIVASAWDASDNHGSIAGQRRVRC
jgi:hypothetical protein